MVNVHEALGNSRIPTVGEPSRGFLRGMFSFISPERARRATITDRLLMALDERMPANATSALVPYRPLGGEPSLSPGERKRVWRAAGMIVINRIDSGYDVTMAYQMGEFDSGADAYDERVFTITRRGRATRADPIRYFRIDQRLTHYPEQQPPIMGSQPVNAGSLSSLLGNINESGDLITDPDTMAADTAEMLVLRQNYYKTRADIDTAGTWQNVLADVA